MFHYFQCHCPTTDLSDPKGHPVLTISIPWGRLVFFQHNQEQDFRLVRVISIQPKHSHPARIMTFLEIDNS
jgi:hypothetical protein